MSSILTNMSAMSAVANLNATQKSLAETQNQISSGLKVSSSKDNAAYFSIATTMRTNIGNLSAVSDSLNLGASVVGTANSAVSNLTSVLQSISKALVSAYQPGTDLDAVNTQIKALRTQLSNTVASASFNGVNLLDGSNTGDVNFVAGVTGSGSATTVQTLSIDASKLNFSNANYAGNDAKVLAKAATATALASATATDTTARADLATATTNNTKAVADLTSAIGSATAAQLKDSSSAQFKAIFGDGAAIDATSGQVTGIVAGSLAAKLVGTDGTVTVGKAANPATTSLTYTAGASATGSLGVIYGAGATETATAATSTSTSVAGKAATAASALTTATANDAAAASALSASQATIANSALFSISQISLSSSGGGTSSSTIQGYIQQVGAAISSVNVAAETLGAASSNIDLQSTYTSALSDALTTGVGSLVDADMNAASTRLNALQTQQQLGVQSLSVANQNSQLILKLFQ